MAKDASGRRRSASATPAPHSLDEALLRAGEHARAALGEAAQAARCLLDAASLAATGVPAEGHEALRRAATWLDRAAASAGTGAEAAQWLAAVADGLDAEIARWEARSRQDPEARAVLRAFLGVREILWEFGLRPSRGEAARPGPRPADPGGPEAERTAGSRAAPRPAQRLERVPVEDDDAPGGRPGGLASRG